MFVAFQCSKHVCWENNLLKSSQNILNTQTYAYIHIFTKNTLFPRKWLGECYFCCTIIFQFLFFQDRTSEEETILGFLQNVHLPWAAVSASICMADIETHSPYTRLNSCKDNRLRHSLAPWNQLFCH